MKGMKKEMKKHQNELTQIQKQQKLIYDPQKLRRTVIRGLPCDQVKFKKTNQVAFVSEGSGLAEGQEIYISDIDPEC